MVIIGGFESGGLSNWNGYQLLDVQQNIVYDGTYALEAKGGVTLPAFGWLWHDTQTIGQESRTSFWFRQDENFGFEFVWPFFVWANDTQTVTGENYPEEGYGLAITESATPPTFQIERYDNGTQTILADTSHSLSNGTWYKSVIEWEDDGTITASFEDTNGNVVKSLTTTDTTYSSGGIGVAQSGIDHRWFDLFKTGPITSPPSNVQIINDQTEDQLTVDWGTSNTGASGYHVYRAESSGSSVTDYTKVGVITNTQYTDTGLEDGEKYYYRVSSYKQPPESGLARWTYDDADTSTGTTTDVWGDNDGQLNNGVTTGVSGANKTYTTNEGFRFDGVDDLVDFGTQLAANRSEFTVGFWAKASSGKSNPAAYVETNNGSVPYFVIYYGQTYGGKVGIKVATADGSGGSYQIRGGDGLDDGNWHHVVMVQRNSSDREVYLDTQSIISDTTQVTTFSTSLNTHGGASGFGQ